VRNNVGHLFNFHLKSQILFYKKKNASKTKKRSFSRLRIAFAWKPVQLKLLKGTSEDFCVSSLMVFLFEGKVVSRCIINPFVQDSGPVFSVYSEGFRSRAVFELQYFE